MESFKIVKIKGDKKETTDDLVAREVPLTIMAGESELATLLCSPGDLKDLVRGFLFTSGLIKKGQSLNITIDNQRWTASVDLTIDEWDKDFMFKRLYTSGCGKGIIFYNTVDIMNRTKVISDFTIKSSRITELMVEFQKKSDGYFRTGGTHSSAIGNKEGIFVFREDIGRHNAIDKVIGAAFDDNFNDKILFTSGRVSSEVLLKARKCGFPLVISQSAPTDQSVKLARDAEITLVGFARVNRMNVYSEEKRII